MLSSLLYALMGILIGIGLIAFADILSVLMVYSRRFLPKDVFDEVKGYDTSPNNPNAGIIFLYEEANTNPIGYINKTLSYIIPYCVTVKDVSYLVHRYSDEFEFFENLRIAYRTYTDEQVEIHDWKLFCKNSIAASMKEGKYSEEDINHHRTFLSKFESSREFQDYFKSETGVNIEYGKDV